MQKNSQKLVGVWQNGPETECFRDTHARKQPKIRGCVPETRYEVMFVGRKSMERGKKEKSSNDVLLFLAPPMSEILNLWKDFLKVVSFIDDNKQWLKILMQLCEKG